VLVGLVAVAGLSRLTLAVEGVPGWTLIGWNDLGMHCMDSDYDVFSILPPYNTIHAQLVNPSGDLVTSGAGLAVTYEAVADPSGSINTTSAGKTGFWDHVAELFPGASPPVDTGLTGSQMPGAGNTPRPMQWEGGSDWFTAEGIPLTPTDDTGHSNPYPLMRLVARDSVGTVLATTDIVLPVSDEMDCRACHASGSAAAAAPAGGWVWDGDPEHDYRRNILRLHDESRAGDSGWSTLLATVGYEPGGLQATVTAGRSILCATCHGSNALPGTGQPEVPPLTRAIHGGHATALDPITGLTLDSSDNRSACYRCHPGSETRCLRGAMGAAVGPAGDAAMQCQSCHGGMSTVGAVDRQGWFDEPTCQNCHTGTATHNNGQIRYTDAYVAPGIPRDAVDTTFATEPDAPAPGVSLYRFSAGHHGLQCSACHGSPHAIYPAAHGNDNLQNIAIQGHAGTLGDCTACHASSPNTDAGGPHGMHPVGQAWIERHKDAASSACRSCHGADSRGTVLSRALGDRVINTEFGTKVFWKGFEIGCYTCHNGPNDEDPNPNRAPVVQNASGVAAPGLEVSVSLSVSDPDSDPLTLRIVSQPAHGAAWIVAGAAHYRSDTAFSGTDTFTFAARDGMTDSNLGTVTMEVGSASSIFADGFESGTTTQWAGAVP
jgi:hypothetical protein